MPYFREIDGLRALAILAVVIFHMNNHWLPGGYLGVDIFFVISGFLITRILLSQQLTGQFSYRRFYQARIQRIFPVFFLMTGLVCIAGLFILLPKDLYRMNNSVLTNLFFVSNYYFSRFSGYFDTGVTAAPLLHSWSLAVEEQFYLFWPLLLRVLCSKAQTLKSRLALVLLLCLGSLLLAELLAFYGRVDFNFYSIFSRAYELLLGAALGMFSFTKTLPLAKNSAISTLGLVLVAYGLFFPSFDHLGPGFATLPVMIGTLLIISAQGSGSITARLLNSRGMNFIGKISYSLYIWHWPLIAYSAYLSGQDNLSWLQALILIPVIFLVSVASYYGVERPLRKKTLTFNQALLRYYLLPGLVLLVFFLPIKWSDGDLSIYGLGAPVVATEFVDEKYCHRDFNKNCTFGETDNPKHHVVLFGDSHAGSYSALFDSLAKQQGEAIDIFSMNACPPLLSLSETGVGQECSLLQQKILTRTDHYDQIFLAANWKHYLKSDLDGQATRKRLLQLLSKLQSAKKSVVLVQDFPAYQAHAVEKFIRTANFYSRLGLEQPPISNDYFIVDPDTATANQQLQLIAAQFDHVSFLPLMQWCQQAGIQLPLIDGQMAYKDSNHINALGSSLLAKKLLAGHQAVDGFWTSP